MISKIANKEYNNIDFVKVCMAFVVVAIHTHPQNSCSIVWIRELLTNIFDIAVPFFFVTSGFFIWNKICDASKEEKILRLKGWIKKTIRLYLLWTLIYIPFTIYGFYTDKLSLAKSLIVFFRNFLLVGENYLSWPLWYLLAMLVAACIIYIMVKCNFKGRTMCFVGIIFALIGYCLDKGIIPSDVYFSLFKTTRNGFFVGIQYILIGMLIASKGIIKSPKILFAILVVSFLFHAFGYKLAKFALIYSFFSLVLQINLKRNNNLYRNLRLTSTIVYFVHMLWMGLITILFPNTLSPILSFSIVAILSMATAVFVIKRQDIYVVKLLFK